MASVRRRTRAITVSRQQQLVAAGDLDGTAATRRAVFVPGGGRVLIFQDNDGVNGTAGIDVVAYSNDGVNWIADGVSGLAIDSDDSTGTVLSGVLNAAGVEPTTVKTSLFKFGPYDNDCYVRICRKTAPASGIVGSVTWVTGSPSVLAVVIADPTYGKTGVPDVITHTAD
jgi:hypothetical protein